MESQRFEKSRGEGVVGAPAVPNSPGASPIQTLCQYRDARGRGCRMPVSALSDNHLAEESDLDVSTEGLCVFHARRLLDRHRAGQAIAAELLASVSDFGDAASVNRFLGNLAKMVALRRIPRRDAVVLAYISQLILNSQAANDRSELLRYQLQLLREKNTPTRVIWDLPERKNAADRLRNSQAAAQAEAQRKAPADAESKE